MFDLINKLGEVKKKMEEVKSRLAHILLDAEAGEGMVKVTVNGNREVKSIDISESLLSPDRREELQDLIEVAMNRALQKAEETNESEMKAAGKDFLPGFPGF
jgi:DNA-binding YbaB/EbfC family protein